MSMPAEPESVNKAIAQQKVLSWVILITKHWRPYWTLEINLSLLLQETSDRLDKMEPKYKGISNEIDSLLEATNGYTPSLEQLRTDQVVAAKKWNNVRYLSKIYLEK